MTLNSFMAARCRNYGRSCILSPKFINACMQVQSRMPRQRGAFAEFNSSGQSLVETALHRHDYIKSRPKSITSLQNCIFRQNSHVGKYWLDPPKVLSWSHFDISSFYWTIIVAILLRILHLNSESLTSITLLFISALLYMILWGLL